jgi:hypothetical protein
MHIGVDDRSSFIHGIEITAGNVHDIAATDHLFHSEGQ